MPKDGGFVLPSANSNAENKGISLRDLIAIAVFLTRAGGLDVEERARIAYHASDAMITERDK